MIFIGIDPGLTGAVAALDDNGKVLSLNDAPVLNIVRSGHARHEPNRDAMAAMLREILHRRDEFGEPFACIERVNSMPGQGVTSSFSFGMGYGIWLGILATLHVPTDIVHPTRWKRTLMDGMDKKKDASRVRALELFGGKVDLSLRKHHGRADALLLAEYRRRLR